MRRGVFRQLLASTSISLSLLVVGTALGWPSPVILAIQQTGQPLNMTTDDISIMVSAIYLGNMVSPIPSGLLMDILGRKNALHLMTIIPISSWLLVYYADSAIFLHIARFLIGLWLGAVGTIVPMYVAEVSEPSVRGAFSTLFQLLTNVGVLFVFLVGSKMDYYDLTYVLGALPVLLGILLFFIPESPYWYVKRGRHESAVVALSWLRCKSPELVKEELTRIESAVTEEMRRSASYRDIVKTRGNRRAFVIVQVLAITQRASGISALMAYASTTLPGSVGVLTPNDCVTVMGLVLSVSVLFSTFLVDKSGRRPLLTISSLGCGFSTISAAIWFFLYEETDFDVMSLSWLPFAGFTSYSFFFCLGLGPLATTVQGELFPTNVKGLASGLTSIILALTSFATNLAYSRIATNFGMYYNYSLFALAAFSAALFTQKYLVETKGKSLVEIQRELNKLDRNTPL